METPSQDSAQTSSQSMFFRVTPFSKYLAMVLFIALPFVGGWIGYTFGVENPPKNINSTATQIAEQGASAEWETFNDGRYGVEFSYPKEKIGIIENSTLALISTIKDGVPQYSKVPIVDADPPKGIKVVRSYDFAIELLGDFVFKNTPAGFEYRYDAVKKEFHCVSRVGSVCADETSRKIGKTDAGMDIYEFGAGDGGYATKRYVVALPDKGVAISFSTYMTEYYNGWLSGPELDGLMQEVLKKVK